MLDEAKLWLGTLRGWAGQFWHWWQAISEARHFGDHAARPAKSFDAAIAAPVGQTRWV